MERIKSLLDMNVKAADMVKMERAMELSALMDEMIALGWTWETFDEDFDLFAENSQDEALKADKEQCRESFFYLWTDRLESV